MATRTPAGERVSFSVKELFLEIKSEIRFLNATVQLKADATALEHINLRVIKLEGEMQERRAVEKYRRWMLGGGGFVGLAIVIDVGLQIWKAVHP